MLYYHSLMKLLVKRLQNHHYWRLEKLLRLRRPVVVNFALCATTPHTTSESLPLLFLGRRSVLLSGGGMSTNIFIAVQKRFTPKTLSPGSFRCESDESMRACELLLAAGEVFVSVWAAYDLQEVFFTYFPKLILKGM